MIALALLSAAVAAPVGLDRVDLLSEDPATWIHSELPRFGTTERFAAVRFVEQVKLVVFTPPAGWTVGLSLQSQSVHYERAVFGTETVFVGGGLQTGALLPRGFTVGGAFRPGRVRIGLSASVLSAATWARPDWSFWQVLPAVGVGIGRDLRTRAPWM